MVQTLATDRSDQPLDVGVLPRGLRRRENFPKAQPVCRFTKLLSVASISISQQVARGAVPRKGFEQLASYPFRRGVFRDGHVDGPTTIVRQNYEDKQHPKENGRNYSEVRRDQILRVVCQERAPRLRRWLPMPHHVLGHCGFR